MAGTFSTYLSNEVLDHVLKTTSYSVPDGIHVALYSVAPTKAGGGTEISGNNYARAQNDTWDAAASGATENTGAIVFNSATGSDWDSAVAFGIFDTSTGGNLLMWGDLTVSKTVTVGDTAQFSAGSLDISVDA